MVLSASVSDVHDRSPTGPKDSVHFLSLSINATSTPPQCVHRVPTTLTGYGTYKYPVGEASYVHVQSVNENETEMNVLSSPSSSSTVERDGYVTTVVRHPLTDMKHKNGRGGQRRGQLVNSLGMERRRNILWYERRLVFLYPPSKRNGCGLSSLFQCGIT